MLVGSLHSNLSAQETSSEPKLKFNGFEFRFIGPGQAGGRISDIQVHPDNSDIVYVSAATGGVFKTEDGCKSWTPVFDQAGTTLSVGDMAISTHNPDVIWVGTGEAGGEQSSASIGDGVYKSIDGGIHWQHMGLSKSQHIARVVIDPSNANRVFVAAAGARWGANPERGLYRSGDGGKSWEKVLYIDENTGISDVVVHPDGQIILASAYMQRRNAWAHVRTGPSSALYRSTDGGDTWAKINAFPNEKMGRIALWMAPSKPKIMYACLESDSGGLYRSKDAGKSWKLVNSRQSTSYWYGRLYGHPSDEKQVMVMGVSIMKSVDGGKKFKPIRLPGVHVDHHIYWINPKQLNHHLLGNDGGLYQSYDGGENWTFIANLPIQQYYAISVDTRDPYYVYGGLQDNGVWGGPSKSYSVQLVNNQDIIRICGGDGFYSASEPHNPQIVYGESQYGFINRVDLRTGERQMIKPKASKGVKHRFNWNTPFFVSSHTPHALYLGGNFVFKSLDQGAEWQTLGHDLSVNQDLSKTLVIGQKPVLKPYASITALAESPLKPGYLLAGSDDGNLHLSKDDGESWTDVSDRLPMPIDRFFTRVLWSTNHVGNAYAACGRYYEANDFSPYLFKTTDFGKTWNPITKGLPDAAIVKGLAEHPSNPDILFAGTHNGLYLSINGGEHWQSFQLNVPPVAIDDIKLSFPDNDLVLGSYGRGIIILDHIGFLSELNEDVLSSTFHVFEPRQVVRSVHLNHTEVSPFYYEAPNPVQGPVIDCWIGSTDLSELTFQIRDEANQLIDQGILEAVHGFNRFELKTALKGGNYSISITAGVKRITRGFKVLYRD